jgi:hypothetical protein
MKKVISVALALAISCTLIACGGNISGNEQSTTDETSSEQEISTDNAANEEEAPVDEQNQDSSERPTVESESVEGAKIQLTIDNEVFTVTMYDNPTSRDFLGRLPLTLTFEDYGGFEKMSILEEGLSTENAPAGSTPSARDFAYFAPWKDVTIFYKEWKYSPGLIQLGKIESGVDELAEKLEGMSADFTVTIERME